MQRIRILWIQVMALLAVAFSTLPPNATAFAQDSVPEEAKPFAVQVGSETYYTGYLGTAPALGGRQYIQFSPEQIKTIPDKYDTRVEGCVPSIRDQGPCGSCWSFSVVGTMEITKCHLAGLTPRPNTLNLAEQDPLANDRTAYGCGGGFMGFDYECNHGVTTEAACPYTARNSSCRSDPVDTQGKTWAFVGSRSGPTPEEIATAIYTYGAVSVTTAAGGSGYDTDANGDFRGCGARGINHMVILVAYEKRADGKYWFLLRNSWGTSWGTQGYGWLTQGCNQTASGAESVAVITIDGPGPKPPVELHLPSEVVTPKGVDVHLGVKPADGVSYSWQDGTKVQSGNMTWVTADQSKVVTATAVDAQGAKVATTINIIVQ